MYKEEVKCAKDIQYVKKKNITSFGRVFMSCGNERLSVHPYMD